MESIYFQFDNVHDYYFSFAILVKNEKHERIEKKVWKNLSWEQINKWVWYFEYRAALFKVKNPKFKIEVSQIKYLKEVEDLEKGKRNKMRACKAKITEMKNKLDRAYKLAEETELFSIDDHPHILKFKKKLAEKEVQLQKYNDFDTTEFYNKNIIRAS